MQEKNPLNNQDKILNNEPPKINRRNFLGRMGSAFAQTSIGAGILGAGTAATVEVTSQNLRLMEIEKSLKGFENNKYKVNEIAREVLEIMERERVVNLILSDAKYSVPELTAYRNFLKDHLKTTFAKKYSFNNPNFLSSANVLTQAQIREIIENTI